MCRYSPYILNKCYKQIIFRQLLPKGIEKSRNYSSKRPFYKKKNYKHVSLLPHMSKICERSIYKQINSYKYHKLSKYITSFRKCHGTQHSLLVMLEKSKKALDKEDNICTIFMDLQIALDTINHDLPLAKLKAYGFPENALKLIR